MRKRFLWGAFAAVALLLGSGGAMGALRLGPLPPGWQERVAPAPGVASYYVLQVGKAIWAEAYFSEEKLAVPMDVKGYFQAFQANGLMAGGFKDYAPGETADVTVGGRPAVRHDFTFTGQGEGAVELKARVFVFMDGPTARAILFDGLRKDFPMLEAQFANFMGAVSLGSEGSGGSSSGSMTTLGSEGPGGSSSGGMTSLGLGVGSSVTPGPSVVSLTPPPPVAGAGEPLSGDDLPSFSSDKAEGELPDLTEPPDPGLFVDASKKIRVRLPDASVPQELAPSKGVYSGPDLSVISVLVLATEQEASAEATRRGAGQTFFGVNTMKNAVGKTCRAGLYASSGAPGPSEQRKATVIATYPGTPLLVEVALPAERYDGAKGWIKALLTGVELP